MRRSQKRRSPHGQGAGFGKQQGQVAPEHDHTLRTLVINYLALPPGHTFKVGSQIYITEEALLYTRAMVERERQLGGPPVLERVVASITAEAA